MTGDPDPPACLPAEEPLVDLGAFEQAGRVVAAASAGVSAQQRRSPQVGRVTPQQNWADKTTRTGDNPGVTRGMNSASADLVCLDPPFNSKTDHAAPIAGNASGAAFTDTSTLSDLDVMSDPFCGCATTMIAADGLGRPRAGLDISPKAADAERNTAAPNSNSPPALASHVSSYPNIRIFLPIWYPLCCILARKTYMSKLCKSTLQ